MKGGRQQISTALSFVAIIIIIIIIIITATTRPKNQVKGRWIDNPASVSID
jgi:hypothetical protein